MLEQQNAQTMRNSSTKVKNPDPARLANNTIARNETGAPNKAGYAADDGTPGNSYSEVPANYDGSSPAD